MLILVEEVKCTVMKSRRGIKRYLRTLLTELSGWDEKRKRNKKTKHGKRLQKLRQFIGKEN